MPSFIKEIKLGLIVYFVKPIGEAFVFKHFPLKSSYPLLIKNYFVKLLAIGIAYIHSFPG